jgi:hypothetical protein
MKYLRAQDQVQVQDSEQEVSGALSAVQFSGTWLNTNTENPGIVRVNCKAEGDTLRVVFFGNGASEPAHWGEAVAELLCAASIRGGPAISFVASFDLGFKTTEVGANLNQGLLVIAVYHSFRNDNGHSNYFSREFFRRAAQDCRAAQD